MNKFNNYLIKRIKTDKGYYVFEGNTSQIMEVDEFTYNNILDVINKSHTNFENDFLANNEFTKSEKVDLRELWVNLEKLKHTVFIPHSSVNLKELKFNTENDLRHMYNRFCPKELVISITPNCNLRCRYCFYNVENYSYSRNNIENKTESINLNKLYKLIRWHNANMKDSEGAISFYGGEPLLAYKKIKQIIDFNKKNGFRYRYGITTNATLLNRDMIDFFIKNNFIISISYDINGKINDKYRVFKNGKGTSDKIEKAIDYIKVYYPFYYKSKLSILSTIKDASDLKEAYNYYNNSKIPVVISQLQKDEKEEINEIMQIYRNRHNKKIPDVITNDIEYQKKEFYKNMKNIMSGKLSILDLSNFDRDLLRSLKFVSLRKNNKNKIHLGGSCIPGGNDKLFIDHKGDFFTCEKLDYCFKLGDIDNGINKEISYEILTRFIEFKVTNCFNCWVKSLCNYCFACFVDTETLDFKMKQSLCYKAKREGVSLLKDYCNLLNEYSEEDLIAYFRQT